MEISAPTRLEPVCADHEAMPRPTLILSVDFLKGAWNHGDH